MTRSSVVLPAPLEPIRPTNSLGLMLNRTSCRTSRPPGRALTPSTVSMSSCWWITVMGSQFLGRYLAGHGGAEGPDLGEHPRLIAEPGGHGLVHADHGDAVLARLPQE